MHANWYNLLGRQYLLKICMYILFGPSILLLGIFPAKYSQSYARILHRMFP